jgi:hypothetical protein
LAARETAADGTAAMVAAMGTAIAGDRMTIIETFLVSFLIFLQLPLIQ